MDLYFARELYEMAINGSDMELDQLEYVSVEGWVRTNRDNGQVGFIELNDGSYFKNIQIVYGPELDNHNEVSHLLTGSSIYVIGKFILTPENKQPFEIRATSIEIEGNSTETYPLQKKRHTFEFLREIPHLRPRTNTFGAVMRMRHEMAYAIRQGRPNRCSKEYGLHCLEVLDGMERSAATGETVELDTQFAMKPLKPGYYSSFMGGAFRADAEMSLMD